MKEGQVIKGATDVRLFRTGETEYPLMVILEDKKTGVVLGAAMTLDQAESFGLNIGMAVQALRRGGS